MSDGSASLCYSKVSCLRSVVYTTRTTVWWFSSKIWYRTDRDTLQRCFLEYSQVITSSEIAPLPLNNHYNFFQTGAVSPFSWFLLCNEDLYIQIFIHNSAAFLITCKFRANLWKSNRDLLDPTKWMILYGNRCLCTKSKNYFQMQRLRVSTPKEMFSDKSDHAGAWAVQSLSRLMVWFGAGAKWRQDRGQFVAIKKQNSSALMGLQSTCILITGAAWNGNQEKPL